ncbi:MAG: SDR family NAD(P)-dependent oxidoreductase [Patescibacteria group bacterium]|nr:SDR family NAD(P)-dependent oxidoreductase [Patescibacteria group bacterium]
MEQLQNKTVLVTGGAGFIGSHLCDELLTNGAIVIAVDNLSTGKLENLSEAQKNLNLHFIKGDVNDCNFLKSVFENNKIDYVFHYAAVLGVKRVMEQPMLVLDDIIGIKNILSLSKDFNVKKVIFSSSSEAYGTLNELPLKEDNNKELSYQTHSTSLYALVKLIGEKMMKIYNDTYNIPTCSLRFFNVFGERQESSAYGFVVGVFIEQVLRGEAPTIFGDGYQTRDFIYVGDNVKMAIKALISEKTNGEVINIGLGRQTTILDLAQRIIKISGKDLSPIFIGERGYEIKYRSPDVSKMYKLLGEKLDDNLDENLKKTYEYYARK